MQQDQAFGRFRRVVTIAACSIAAVLSAATARATDFFQLTATPSGGNPVQAGGGDLRSLINDMTLSRGSFASLSGKAYTAQLTYAGGNSAFKFNGSADGKQLTLQIPTQNFTQTFDAANQATLQSDVQQFVQSGVNAYSRLLILIGEKSGVGLLDGNPHAATAVFADDAFFRWGITPTLPQSMKLPGTNGAQLRFDFDGGVIHTGPFNGNYATGALGMDWRINNNVAISLGVPFQYRELAGTKSYIAGGDLGVPIMIIPRELDGFAWQVTPFLQGWGAMSGDLVAGGVLVGGGGVSSLSYQVRSLTFTLADQVSYNGGVGLDFNQYHFNTDVNQWIFKNGVKAAYTPGGGPFYLDGGLAYTSFLHNAAVDQYFTPFVGVGVKFSRYSGVRVGFRGNYGNNYNDAGGDVTGYVSF